MHFGYFRDTSTCPKFHFTLESKTSTCKSGLRSNFFLRLNEFRTPKVAMTVADFILENSRRLGAECSPERVKELKNMSTHQLEQTTYPKDLC